MPSADVKKCSKLLADKGVKIAFVESATAGRLCSEFSLCSESGKILMGGLVCYDAQLKKDILNIPAEIIKLHTPESAEVTRLLATNAKPFLQADIVVATTGLLNEGGSETKEKPVGTMFIHIYSATCSISRRLVFEGSPEERITQTIDSVAQMLVERIDDI